MAQTDRHGYVTIKNGDTEAKIVPESLRVWVERGWTEVETDPNEKPEPTEVNQTEKSDKA
jgi:hypothetical protein